MNAQTPVLEVRDLVKHYSVGGSFFGRGRKQLRGLLEQYARERGLLDDDEAEVPT